MKNEDKKHNEDQLKSTGTNEKINSGREDTNDRDKKETLAEKARREGWTDVAESHLGIDE